MLLEGSSKTHPFHRYLRSWSAGPEPPCPPQHSIYKGHVDRHGAQAESPFLPRKPIHTQHLTIALSFQPVCHTLPDLLTAGRDS